MSVTSGLAAVHLAAAAASTSLQKPPAAPPAPATTSAAAPGDAPATLADLNAAFPDLCVALRAEGAASERARILGIEAHAMPGHEALVASLKADGSVTPDIAAGRILAAEKAARGTQLQAIRDVETATGKVPAAPSSQPSATAVDEKATTPEGWAKEYEASTALQAEFATAADYVAIKRAETNGKVRVLGARSGN